MRRNMDGKELSEAIGDRIGSPKKLTFGSRSPQRLTIDVFYEVRGLWWPPDSKMPGLRRLCETSDLSRQ